MVVSHKITAKQSKLHLKRAHGNGAPPPPLYGILDIQISYFEVAASAPYNWILFFFQIGPVTKSDFHFVKYNNSARQDVSTDGVETV